jgi:hypothetical protein
MGADHQYTLVVAQQTKLVLQCHDSAGRGRLELSSEGNGDEEERGDGSGENGAQTIPSGRRNGGS